MSSSTGTIVAINQRSGLFVVQAGGGGFAVFELMDSIDLAVGDRVSGDLDAMGDDQLTHLGQGEAFDVYGQSGPCSLEHARRLIGA